MYSYINANSNRGTNLPGSSSGACAAGPGKGVGLGIAGIAKKSGAGATFTAFLALDVSSAVPVVTGTPSAAPLLLCRAKLGSARSALTTTVRHHSDIIFLP